MIASATRPSAAARVRYALRVLRSASGVIAARVRPLPASEWSGRPPAAFNTMFNRARLDGFAPERRALETFDLYLFEAMNAPRLGGQLVFEHATLLRAIDRWSGIDVLDIGTGRSTFPRWMSSRGARVVTFDLPQPVERQAAGFHDRVDRLIASDESRVRAVAGSMLRLPFADASFDLVTSISVVEHLDTDCPSRAYVPYPEQQRRLHIVLDEMVRVARPGGRIYLTSECCDYALATSDSWRSAYYYKDGPPLSAAWPVEDVPALFYEYLKEHGCDLAGGVAFRAADIADESAWTGRGPYFGGFSVVARKRRG